MRKWRQRKSIQIGTLNLVFCVTYYLELRGARSLYQVKFLVFFNVQTTDLTIVGMM